jgi:uncharacterized membrane protein YfcA
MPNPPLLMLVGIGALAGALSGLFGIGGGVIIVPALVYFAGFDQHLATGTSLAILLPPVGIGAALEYYRQGRVDLRSAVVIAVTLLLCAWLASMLANRVSGPYLRLMFGVFVVGLGLSLIYSEIASFRA